MNRDQQNGSRQLDVATGGGSERGTKESDGGKTITGESKQWKAEAMEEAGMALRE